MSCLRFLSGISNVCIHSVNSVSSKKKCTLRITTSPSILMKLDLFDAFSLKTKESGRKTRQSVSWIELLSVKIKRLRYLFWLESLTGREWEIVSHDLSPLIEHEHQNSVSMEEIKEKINHVILVLIEHGHSRDAICHSLPVRLSNPDSIQHYVYTFCINYTNSIL